MATYPSMSLSGGSRSPADGVADPAAAEDKSPWPELALHHDSGLPDIETLSLSEDDESLGNESSVADLDDDDNVATVHPDESDEDHRHHLHLEPHDTNMSQGDIGSLLAAVHDPPVSTAETIAAPLAGPNRLEALGAAPTPDPPAAVAASSVFTSDPSADMLSPAPGVLDTGTSDDEGDLAALRAAAVQDHDGGSSTSSTPPLFSPPLPTSPPPTPPSELSKGKGKQKQKTVNFLLPPQQQTSRPMNHSDSTWETSTGRPPVKLPIRFRDAVGRNFVFPWEKAKTYEGMTRLIKACFKHVDPPLGLYVLEGRYDLIAETGVAFEDPHTPKAEPSDSALSEPDDGPSSSSDPPSGGVYDSASDQKAQPVVAEPASSSQDPPPPVAAGSSTFPSSNPPVPPTAPSPPMPSLSPSPLHLHSPSASPPPLHATTSAKSSQPSTGPILLPELWSEFVVPGMLVSMHMWPLSAPLHPVPPLPPLPPSVAHPSPLSPSPPPPPHSHHPHGMHHNHAVTIGGGQGRGRGGGGGPVAPMPVVGAGGTQWLTPGGHVIHGHHGHHGQHGNRPPIILVPSPPPRRPKTRKKAEW